MVYAWGNNDKGQLGTGIGSPPTNIPVIVPGLPNNIVEVDANISSSYALTADHRLFVWGLNDMGQLGDGTFTTRLSPEEIFAPAGMAFMTLDTTSNGNHVLAILTAVPEPSSILMLGSVAIIGGIGALRYRRKQWLRQQS